MSVYYNEIEPYAAQWLRNLIAADIIAPGYVDERSILNVEPADLIGFKQCHFFAGIGVWSGALRAAAWNDDRPVWTGSCPCQPFSGAGQRKGFTDERHLWPYWHHLIRVCRPPVVFGEQVGDQDGLMWLDLVQADLEGLGYACGATVIPAAGFGAPHGRHRTFFVAYPLSAGWTERRPEPRDGPLTRSGAGRVADSIGAGLEGRNVGALGDELTTSERSGCAGELADATSRLASDGELQRSGQHGLQSESHGGTESVEHAESEQAWVSRFARERRATGGYWGDADWIPCRGDKWRPVEPGTFPLAHGVANRMGKLRAYGNAIVLPVAQAFIEAAMSVLP